MKLLAELVHAHAGRAAVVIGGAMTAPAEFTKCPVDAVRIGTNMHGFKLGCRLDYVVAIDQHDHNGDDMVAQLVERKVPVISFRRYATYRFFKEPVPNSGMIAAWAAWVMGCAPVIIIGVNFYKGGTYFHAPQAKSSGTRIRPQMQMQRWDAMAKQCPGHMFRVLGGPLLDLFPLYRLGETVPPLPIVPMDKKLRGTKMQVTKAVPIKNGHIQPGDHELTQAEVRQVLGVRGGKVVHG